MLGRIRRTWRASRKPRSPKANISSCMSGCSPSAGGRPRRRRSASPLSLASTRQNSRRTSSPGVKDAIAANKQLDLQTIGEPLVGGNGVFDARAAHIRLEFCRVEAKLRGDAERLLLGGTPPLGEQPLMQLEIFALGDRGLRDPRHVLRIRAEHGELLQHEPHLAIVAHQLLELGGTVAAIRAVVVEEDDDLTSPPDCRQQSSWASGRSPPHARRWHSPGGGRAHSSRPDRPRWRSTARQDRAPEAGGLTARREAAGAV